MTRKEDIFDPLEARCAALIAALGLDTADAMRAVVPLTGGVASDIARVDLPDRVVCLKFALPKLKVAADWRAPVHRNAAEYAWLRVAAQVAPENAVTLFGRSEPLHGFAMEFIDGDAVYLWKSALLAGHPPRGEAAQVGAMLGRIHAASTAPSFDRTPFQNRDDFHALRSDPYLLYPAAAYPDLASSLSALAQELYETATVLVHGDVSPKNILMRDRVPVLLDAECATMGDAAFDVGFCLTHLILKAIHLPQMRGALLQEVGALWLAYAPHVIWEPLAGLESRVCRLLPALLLARVDGKSPVEYLDHPDQSLIRRLAVDLLGAPPQRLEDLVKAIAKGAVA